MEKKNYSSSLHNAIRLSKSMASRDKHATYGVSHLVLSCLLEDTGLEGILESLGKDVAYIQDWFEMRKEVYAPGMPEEGMIIPDEEVLRVMDEAERSKLRLGTDYIDALCVFLAVIRNGVVYDDQQLKTINISEEEILQLYDSPIHSSKVLGEAQIEEIAKGISYCSLLNTQEVIDEGKLIVGRDKEIRTIMESLERQDSCGILLVGDSGVGKTGLIKSLVSYLVTSTNPFFINKEIIALNASKLLANSANPNEVTKKLSGIFDKIKQLEDCILVIDDLQVLTESQSGATNAVVNLISSELNDGSLNLIATMSFDAYRKTIEKHTINRKLELVELDELTDDLVLKCMENHRYNLTAYYQIKIENAAIQECIQHSKRYYKEVKLPYGAIDLLDRSLAAVSISNKNASIELEHLRKQLDAIPEESPSALIDATYLFRLLRDRISPILYCEMEGAKEIDSLATFIEVKEGIHSEISTLTSLANAQIKELKASHVSAIVAARTGIPIGKIQAEEKERLLHIEERLAERVKGQDHAISTLSDAIIESRSGLSNPKQPIGSFFFLGPTGTGKTELTKSLAELLFDDENAMIRFDMSEFKEEHSAALLYGAPPGYVGYEEGGMLVNKIRQKPYSVVLFDEIEKAHHSVYDVFLQIMDEGQIHDKLGREGDFSNAIIIFTSNIGSEWIAEQITKGLMPSSNQLIDVMTNHFRPEFLGRLTEVVPFAPISEMVAQLIFTLQFNKLQAQLKEQKEIDLQLTNEALQYLSAKGYSHKYGARPIAGVIRTYLKKAVSRMIVAEAIVAGDAVEVSYKEEQLVWEKL